MNSKPKFIWPCGKSSAIMVAESIIEEELCQSIIGECKTHYDKLFYPGPVISGIFPDIKSSMDMNWSDGEVTRLGAPSMPFLSYEGQVVDALFSCIEYYRETFRWLWEWPGLSDTGFRLQHYRKNSGFYREHIDGGPGPGVAADRMLGAIIYLNTVETGGETYFREHDLKIPAKAGSIALFPAYWTHPHQGCVPISDDKWIVSSFVVKKTEEQENTTTSTPMPLIDND